MGEDKAKPSIPAGLLMDEGEDSCRVVLTLAFLILFSS
jgi:hypothetical protein